MNCVEAVPSYVALRDFIVVLLFLDYLKNVDNAEKI